jgi:hypothetical protein
MKIRVMYCLKFVYESLMSQCSFTEIALSIKVDYGVLTISVFDWIKSSLSVFTQQQSILITDKSFDLCYAARSSL